MLHYERLSNPQNIHHSTEKWLEVTLDLRPLSDTDGIIPLRSCNP